MEVTEELPLGNFTEFVATFSFVKKRRNERTTFVFFALSIMKYFFFQSRRLWNRESCHHPSLVRMIVSTLGDQFVDHNFFCFFLFSFVFTKMSRRIPYAWHYISRLACRGRAPSPYKVRIMCNNSFPTPIRIARYSLVPCWWWTARCEGRPSHEPKKNETAAWSSDCVCSSCGFSIAKISIQTSLLLLFCFFLCILLFFWFHLFYCKCKRERISTTLETRTRTKTRHFQKRKTRQYRRRKRWRMPFCDQLAIAVLDNTKQKKNRMDKHNGTRRQTGSTMSKRARKCIIMTPGDRLQFGSRQIQTSPHRRRSTRAEATPSETPSDTTFVLLSLASCVGWRYDNTKWRLVEKENKKEENGIHQKRRRKRKKENILYSI